LRRCRILSDAPDVKDRGCAVMESLLPRLGGSSPTKDWIRKHLDYSDDWCLIWPFSRSQAGYATFGVKATAVHRLMCEYRNGPPPTPKHQACHSCGRGKDGCVNPKHVSWKTNAENQIERYQHSGLTKRAKLTPDQVEEIRALKGKMPVGDIARTYGVTPLNIHRIHAGKLWHKTSTLITRTFSPEEVMLIRSTPWQVKSAGQFAKEFGVNRAAIDRIRTGKTYKWVPMPQSAQPGTELPSHQSSTQGE
jgi:hypothetical protein